MAQVLTSFVLSLQSGEPRVLFMDHEAQRRNQPGLLLYFVPSGFRLGSDRTGAASQPPRPQVRSHNGPEAKGSAERWAGGPEPDSGPRRGDQRPPFQEGSRLTLASTTGERSHGEAQERWSLQPVQRMKARPSRRRRRTGLGHSKLKHVSS